MNKIQILDCTLRDGGYCNQWQFGFNNIKKIIFGLVESNIDIVECGFITENVDYSSDSTKFTSINDVSCVLPQHQNNKHFVAMINYGEYNIDNLPVYDGKSIDGIRLAFHKKDMNNALEMCRQIKSKGYKVFVQAMVSLSYSDEEFLNLINGINLLDPYAFYIVDSFGVMKERDLIRLFNTVENNLNKNICIGFHSHNNMQLSYSNAQRFANMKTNHTLIIDSSVYGMGRGAGNLNTELFVEYLNENKGTNYKLKPLLKIIDSILNEFYQQNSWGYSLPNYLSAVHNAHPNYANYLDDKKTLMIEDMYEIFSMMDCNKKLSYDKNYVENLYLKYMTTEKTKEFHKTELSKIINNKNVLLIAPGKSSFSEKDKIINFTDYNDIITISVNFDYKFISTDFIFISNLRRFKDLSKEKHNKCIITSNISSNDVYLKTKYSELLSDEESVRDNAGLMAIKFLIIYGAKNIYLAGFDGYSHDDAENYGDMKMTLISKNSVLDSINSGMLKVLEKYKKEINISFLTTSKYIVS